MGIRYDRDSRRATNGPMIFFSIIHDETFEEEIRSAFISGLSFYAYRFPHDNMISYGSSEGYEEGFGTPGFVIGMFSDEKPIITIPYKGIKPTTESISYYSMPESSTSKKEYESEVKEIIEQIKEGKGKKVVAARVMIENDPFDIAEKFYELCDRFQDAYVFCFATPATGCWIGASPELLVQCREGNISAMALAGTRKIEYDDLKWDNKNLEEQKIVADYLMDVFKKNNLNPLQGNTFNLKTGEIEHICTFIEAEKTENLNLKSFIRDLYPTPALCGDPKEWAMHQIMKLENFDRGCYGGFCGPYHSDNDFTFNVVLRCASLTERKICYYAGGGITGDSIPTDEWNETELKLKAIKSSS